MNQLEADIYKTFVYQTETNCIAEYIIYSCIYDYDFVYTYAG